MHTYIHVTVIKKYEVVNLGESLRDTEKLEERGTYMEWICWKNRILSWIIESSPARAELSHPEYLFIL